MADVQGQAQALGAAEVQQRAEGLAAEGLDRRPGQVLQGQAHPAQGVEQQVQVRGPGEPARARGKGPGALGRVQGHVAGQGQGVGQVHGGLPGVRQPAPAVQMAEGRVQAADGADRVHGRHARARGHERVVDDQLQTLEPGQGGDFRDIRQGQVEEAARGQEQPGSGALVHDPLMPRNPGPVLRHSGKGAPGSVNGKVPVIFGLNY